MTTSTSTQPSAVNPPRSFDQRHEADEWLQDFLAHVNRGAVIEGGSEQHTFMHRAAQEALRIVAELNTGYRTPEEVLALLSQLTRTMVDESVTVFPPFYLEAAARADEDGLPKGQVLPELATGRHDRRGCDSRRRCGCDQGRLSQRSRCRCARQGHPHVRVRGLTQLIQEERPGTRTG